MLCGDTINDDLYPTGSDILDYQPHNLADKSIMPNDILLLCFTSVPVAFLHTLMGPDHYVPFIALSRDRQWTLRKTYLVIFGCALAHVFASAILAMFGVYLGWTLDTLTGLNDQRGVWAAWGLSIFGLLYASLGLRQGFLKKPHLHWHSHNGVFHKHIHVHDYEHRHSHIPSDLAPKDPTAWALFLIFILGPCEPLILLIMLPAATASFWGVFSVLSSFWIVTLLTVLAIVTIAYKGLDRLSFGTISRFGRGLTGATIAACGFSIIIFEM